MMKLIDCGLYAVWSYRRPHLHTRDRRRMEGPFVTEWAYCLRSACGTSWRTSGAVSGFASEQEARLAGMAASGIVTWPTTLGTLSVEWRCKKCGGGGAGDVCACGGTMAALPEVAVK